jgi:WD40 repeat protein
MMTDQAQPFKPKDVEQQVDQLSSSGRETYGNSPPDQRFLHDLRLVLAAQESDAQSQEQEDEGFLQHAWARIEGTGISPHTMQREDPPAKQKRFTGMATLPSTPERPISQRSKFKHGWTTLVATAVALVLVGTLAIFTLVFHNQQQPTPITGAAPTPTATQTRDGQGATSYVYHQSRMPIYSLQWSPDGTRIISANENVYGWDAFSGAHKIKYTQSSATKPQILFVQLSPNGKTLAIWNVGQIDLYDVATGKHLETLTYPFSQATAVKFNQPHFGPYISWSLDGNSIRALVQIPAGNQSLVNRLVTYNVATGTRQELRLSLNEQLDQAAWSPNGKYVAVGRPFSGIVSVMDIATGQIVSSLHAGAPIETIPLNWSPDSRKLVADFGNGGLYVWDAATAKEVVVYQGGTQPTWSPNGKYIAVTNGTTVKILDASNGKLLQTYASQASSLAWSPDSASLAAGGADASEKGLVNVWKLSL